LVELMGGSIFVDSAPGRGSTFVFTARVAQLTGTGCVDAALDVDHAREELKRRHGGARILVVDDDGDNRDVAQWLVEDAGLTADVACNGAAALDMLGEASYALVLMDVYMPVLDGLAATRAIRARPGHIHVPVIAMTASVLVEDRARCIAAGMNDHVPKPVDAAQLYAKMLEWMGHDKRDAETGRPGQNIAWSDYSGS
ncbi:MAG: response regulator, partial [Rhodocyclaceae bacterium]|nr:response regulator [Rhodocyclaceae bacterium]